jgi:hypothetical protein
MGKVAQVLIEGYWPDRVPRRVAVPQVPLGKEFGRVFRKVEPNAPAIISGEQTISYQTLLDDAKILSTGLISATDLRSTVALWGLPNVDILSLFVASQLAGCKVAFIDPTLPDDMLIKQVAKLSPDLLILDEKAGGNFPDEIVTMSIQQLRQAKIEDGNPSERRGRWRDVAVLLPFKNGFSGHSHASVIGMIKALATYIPELEQSSFACTGPVHRWDIFAFAITALMSGKTIVIDPNDSTNWIPQESYGVITRSEADVIVERGKASRIESELLLLFAIISDFDLTWRKRLENILGRVVLPLWGTPQTGPAIAAHPSWVPLEVHGLPLTNVMLLPIDPTSGQPSEVPWEMLARAELGVESPTIQVREQDDELSESVFDWQGKPVVRTGRIVEGDRLGMVRFLDAK